MSQSGVAKVVTGGNPTVEFLTGNTGGPVGPDAAFNINIPGNNSSGINVVGNPGTNTLTIVGVQSTTTQQGTITLATHAQVIAGTDDANAVTSAGLAAKLGTQTAHGVAIFEGSTSAMSVVAPTANTGAVLQNNAGADPTYSTATYPSTSTINQILYSTAANTIGGLATANQGVLTTGATGTPVITALATNGQLIIGSTAGVPAAATLSAGTGISITNGANSITISNTGTSTLAYTAVNHAASPYTVLGGDEYIAVDSTAGVVSILLPNAPVVGRVFIVKDTKAQAVANNITVTTVGGAVTIDGATTYVMKTNYQSVELIFNGTSYEVF